MYDAIKAKLSIWSIAKNILEQLTQSLRLLVLRHLPPHVDRALPCLLQQTDKLEHRAVLEADLNARAVCESTLRRRLQLECQIVGSERWLVETRGEDIVQLHRE